MAGIFIERIWQPCICQPNELKREIKKKTGGGKRGAKQKTGWRHGPPSHPLRIATAPLLRDYFYIFYISTPLKSMLLDSWNLDVGFHVLFHCIFVWPSSDEKPLFAWLDLSAYSYSCSQTAVQKNFPKNRKQFQVQTQFYSSLIFWLQFQGFTDISSVNNRYNMRTTSWWTFKAEFFTFFEPQTTI